MLDADVDTLFDIAIADALVDDDADGGFSDVVDDAGFAVVDFMGHAVELLGSSHWKDRLEGRLKETRRAARGLGLWD